MQIVFLHPHIREKKREEMDGLTKALYSEGVEPIWLEPSSSRFNPLRDTNPFIRALDLPRALRVMLHHRDADLVVSIFESGGLWILLLRRLFWFKPKVVLWDSSTSNTWRVVRWIQKLVLPRYDGFLMLTDSQISYLRFHSKPDAVFCNIGYNIDEQVFHPVDGTDCLGDEYILAIGEDDSRDFNLLLDACPQEIPILLKTRWRPSAMTAHPKVLFESRRLTDSAYRKLIANCKFVVIPLHDTNHPGGITTLYEAMAMGKAVIVSQSPIAEEIVRPNRTGAVVPLGDAHALKENIAKFWEDSHVREECGLRGRKFIEENGTYSSIATRINAAAHRCKGV
ncbi:glycosyltransferase [Roseimaritima ulvae]|uniref:Glycosyl transferases group 1 n=1 Tax=Roseimaritima ulvae TaxID=980254 RepID=A0A5B9QWX7_9BACT|nr:glycosyltransferase [Roseimaritima ulvae]QEG42502.1 Glycosyl transferases group 1 [Roseimaritima ulvae]